MINVDIDWQSFESLSSLLNVNLFSNISSRWGRVRVIYLLKHQTSEETQDLRSRWHFKMSWVGQSVIGTLDTIDSEEEASFWESDTSPVSRISWMKVEGGGTLKTYFLETKGSSCGSDGEENGECLPSIAVILSLCPIMAIRSLSQITQQQHQTTQLYISLWALFA